MYSKDAGWKPQLSGSATSPLGDAHCLMTVRSISASLAGETQALGVRKICCVVQVNQDGSHPSPGAPTTAPSKSSGSRSIACSVIGGSEERRVGKECVSPCRFR